MSEDQLIPLTMPKWGMSMEAGKVVEWLVDEGAQINIGDEIIEVETEKIVNAMESHHEGTLSRQVAQPGEELPIGALLGVISTEDVESESIDAFVMKYQNDFVPEVSEDQDSSSSQSITIDNRTITYREIKAKNENGKLPIIMIHGFGSDRDSWLFNIAELNQEHTLFLIDIPGHGGSSKNVGDGTLVFYSGFIKDFMDALGIEKASLIGHSMGATIAAAVAVADPARVASLVLISGGGLGETVEPDFLNGFVQADRRKELKRVLQQLFTDPELVSSEMVNDILKYKRIEGVNEALGTTIEAIFPDGVVAADHTSALVRGDIPVTVIWGREDRIAVLKSADNLNDVVQFNCLEGCGHIPHMEAANKVNALITSFLTTID